jgi:hypothetical protein
MQRLRFVAEVRVMERITHTLSYLLPLTFLGSLACSEADFQDELSSETDESTAETDGPIEEGGQESGGSEAIDELFPGPESSPSAGRILSFQQIDGVYEVVAEPGDILRERFDDVARIEIFFDGNHIEVGAFDHADHRLVSVVAHDMDDPGTVHDLLIEFEGGHFDLGLEPNRLFAQGELAGIPYGIDASFDAQGVDVEKENATSLPPTMQARLTDVEALTSDAMPVFEEIASLPLEDSIECKGAKMAAATAALVAGVACCAATEGIGCPLCTLGATLFVAAVEVC